MSINPYLNLLTKVDFGDIDGLFDPKLEKHFVDFNFWHDLIEKDTFFIIGRKGTGKSALYKWIEMKGPEKNTVVANLSFKNFPFEKLLSLSDESFQAPNQYQSIWRHIILSEIARALVKDQSNPVTEELTILNKGLV